MKIKKKSKLQTMQAGEEDELEEENEINASLNDSEILQKDEEINYLKEQLRIQNE